MAIRTVNKLADDEAKNFPRASEIVKRDLYVYNLLTGANSLREILEIRDELIDLCKRGHFNLRQWASNHRHGLDNMHEKIFNTDNIIDKVSVINTLGISWKSTTDSFIYTARNVDCNTVYTKRNILSQVAKIFDPLGLLVPIVLCAKLFMQECWRLKDEKGKSTSWDSPVTSKLNSRWCAFLHQLKDMTDIVIPRHLLIDKSREIQLHGFCDASLKGYGACIYLRSINSAETILVRLICSKSRVAPVKSTEAPSDVTIPRLELCAAHLLARLYNETIAALPLKIDRKIFWSDSTIVLQRLKKSPQSLPTFEANRVRGIQTLEREIEWRHVRSQDNPADSLSRGQYPIEFSHNNMWFSGPKWLGRSESLWPSHEHQTNTLIENSGDTCLFTSKNKDKFKETSDIFKRFSSYSTLINALTYCYRFRLSNNYRGFINVKERAETEIKVLRLIQKEQFGDQIDTLVKSKPLKNGKLKSLAPFIDQNGLLRVGGRLINAKLTYEEKHPVLLPTRYYVTDLIIKEAHFNYHHAGIQSTLFYLRHKFWLLDGKNQVRKIVRNCLVCLRHRPNPIQYQMANLPAYRVNAASAFLCTGVDFFGPMYIKEKKFRNRVKLKSYGCVFICMSTKQSISN